MNFNKYKEENDKLFEWILNKNFFEIWKSRKVNSNYSDTKDLELYITADCNLKCEYCYLKNYGDFLYPSNIRTHENILKNIEILFNYIMENNFYIGKMELFSGEIWHTSFGVEILQLILNFNKKYKFLDIITIPTNGTFVNYEFYSNKIKYFIDEFEKIGIVLHISFSIDGYVIEEKSRPLVDGERKNLNDFYSKIFKFAKQNRKHIGFHPMVSSYCSENLIDNYKWWFTVLKENDLGLLSSFMALEVRNSDWTEDSIKNYIDFIEWRFKFALNHFNNDKAKMAEFIFRLDDIYRNNTMSLVSVGDRMPCSIQHNLCVRVGDLSICPCHRLSYNNKIFGKFKIENGRIVGVTSNNVELAVRIWTFNPKMSMVKCDSCGFKNLCLKGCLGSQYETTGEMFNPLDCICELFKAKIYTIIKLCDKYELFDSNINFDDDKKEKIYFHIIETLQELFNSNDWKEYVERYE